MLGIRREMKVCQNMVMAEKSPNSNYGYYSKFVLKGTVPLRTLFSNLVLKGTVLLRTNCSVYNGGRIDYKIWLIFI